MHSNDESDDVPDLDAIDQDIRINELEEQAKEMGFSGSYTTEECTPAMHEQFLRNVMEWESLPESSHLAEMEKTGITFSAPESMDDETLHKELWRLIRALARRETFLEHTDHMSDRQLYAYLWKEGLREVEVMPPQGQGWMCSIDPIGSYGEKEMEIYFKYYMKAKERRQWVKDHPEEVIPPREKPPFDRDRHLPQLSDDVV